MTTGQRFCPLCDKSFAAGEAVLRCTGCRVLHHPGCWVRNGGCATTSPHESAPTAMAYELEPPLGEQAPHPGEGTRTFPAAPRNEQRDPIAFAPRPRPQQPSQSAGAYQPPPFEELPEAGEDAPYDDGSVIGADDIPPADTPAPPIMGAGPPPTSTLRTRQRIQYATEGGRRPSNRRQDEMPKVYRRHRLLAFWYIPAAVLLAVGIAWGVVLLGDQLFGDDGGAPADDDATPTATVSPTSSSGAATTGTPGTASAATQRPGTATAGTPTVPAGAGQPATVNGTAPDCLNIRPEPGTSNQAVDCLPDGTAVSIVSEPQTVGGISWVRITTAAGHDGWVAAEYLEQE